MTMALTSDKLRA